MKQRILSETAILVIFMIVALLVILIRNVPTHTANGVSAEDYILRGDKFYETGRQKFNEAATQYWEALKLNPDIPIAHFRLANIYYEYIWNYEALNELNELERIDPDYPELYLLQGKLYDRMGESDKSFEALQLAVAKQPGNSEAHYYLGTVYQQKGMQETAINEYMKAVKIPVTDESAALKAHLQIGRIYAGKREQEKAEREYKAALGIDPASVEVISELRNLYEQMAEGYEVKDDFNKAADMYDKMIKIDPNNPRNVMAYMELGKIYKSNELYDKAADMFEAAARLDPSNFDAFSALKELELLRK